MKSEVTIFENAEFGKVRVQVVDGEPMFCLCDVASALKYSNPSKAVIDHCKGVTILETPTNGGMQRVKYGKESEVYRLVMKAKTEKAEEFQDWVCGEVLPSIRKTGGYLLAGDKETPEEIMARALLVAQDTLRRRDERIMQLEKTNAILMHVNATYTATELAKELNLRSAQELNKKLAELGVQYKANNTWVMYAKYSSLGYEEIKQEVLDNGRVVYHRKFTQLGRDFIVNLMNEASKAKNSNGEKSPH